MDEKDLKIMAYKQRLSDSEETIIDMRVTITVLRQHIDELEGRLKEKDEFVQEEASAAQENQPED